MRYVSGAERLRYCPSVSRAAWRERLAARYGETARDRPSELAAFGRSETALRGLHSVRPSSKTLLKIESGKSVWEL